MVVSHSPTFKTAACSFSSLHTCKDFYRYVYDQLEPLFESPGECRSVALRLLEYYFHCDSLSIHVAKPFQPHLPEDEATFAGILQRLYAHEPLQYIMESAPFMGRTFFVTPAVLIPRPETEAWVTSLIQKHSSQAGLSILDLGTGSGCIAVTLAKELFNAHVTGLDVSTEALAVAQHNAKQYQAGVDWLTRDILRDALPDKKWNVFVSNPPYVPQSEQAHMHRRVWAYEPSQAIFVPDACPLLLYEPIIQWAKQHLYKEGYIYLEIHEKYGREVAQILANHYFGDVKIEKDLQGKDRLVTAIRL